MDGLLQQQRRACPDCGEPCDDFDGHANFRDDSEGYCTRCGRTRAWHAGTSCFCRFATGLPAPHAGFVPPPMQLTLEAHA